jgi:hypothetical protein
VRTKQLSWSVRVVSSDQYHVAKAQALDVQRERKKFELQRFAVQRCAVHMQSAQVGSLVHETSVLHDHAQEERCGVCSCF